MTQIVGLGLEFLQSLDPYIQERLTAFLINYLIISGFAY